MPILSMLLKLWALNKTVSSTTPLFAQLFIGMVAVTLLAVFSAILLALLVGGGLWGLYTLFTAYGLEPLHAMVALIGIVLVALLSVALIIRQKVLGLRNMALKIFYLQHPLGSRVSGVTDAFMQGFNSADDRARKSK